MEGMHDPYQHLELEQPLVIYTGMKIKILFSALHVGGLAPGLISLGFQWGMYVGHCDVSKKNIFFSMFQTTNSVI